MKISQLPPDVKEKALFYQKKDNSYYSNSSDLLHDAFEWMETKEGLHYWSDWGDKEFIESAIKEPKHYDNTKGSLYQFCDDKQLNTYEFDIIKRVMRCRKKGNFLEDLEKTKFLIDLYIKEHTENLDFPHRQS